jgi:hypothetical protein
MVIGGYSSVSRLSEESTDQVIDHGFSGLFHADCDVRRQGAIELHLGRGALGPLNQGVKGVKENLWTGVRAELRAPRIELKLTFVVPLETQSELERALRKLRDLDLGGLRGHFEGFFFWTNGSAACHRATACATSAEFDVMLNATDSSRSWRMAASGK